MAEPPIPEDCDPRIRRLYEYWQGARPGAGRLPGRQHIDPAAIRDLLPWLWMVDVERDPLRFRYRLLGTEQVHAMERDLTGRLLDEAHPSFVGSSSYPHYVAAAERGEIGYRRGPPTFHVSKDYIAIERLLLPLARDGATVDMLLAITLYFSPDRPDRRAAAR
jgi:PAS domain